MASLGVTDIDSVQKNCDLVERPPSDTDVRLYSHVTPLADINPNGILQQIVHTLRRNRSNVVTVEHSYHPCRLTDGHRNARAGHLHFSQLVQFLLCMIFCLR